MYQTIEEILDFAISEEAGAVAFYTGLADKMPQPGIKELLLSFADEERGHKQKLLAVKSGKSALKNAGSVPNLKIADYLTDVEPSLDVTYQDALIIAMKKEKAAYAMYTDLAENSADDSLKELFLGLAREEANHKLRFEIEYDGEVMREN